MKARKLFLIVSIFISSYTTVSAQMDTIIATSNPMNAGTIYGEGEYSSGSDVKLEAIPNLGYAFSNWTENGLGVSSDSIYSFISTQNRSLVANFNLNTYSISANSLPDGGGSVTGTGNFDHGDLVELEAIPNIGYTFINWTENGLEVSQDSIYSFNSTQNRLLVANFSLNSYSISANSLPDEGGSITGTGNFEHGDLIQLEAIPNLGYTFINWTENGLEVSQGSNYTFTATQNLSLTANYSLNMYYISGYPDPIDGGTIVGAGEYAHGTDVELTAISNEGYSFLNWAADGIEISADSTYTFVALDNMSLTANFSLKSYSISTDVLPLEAGSVLGAGDYFHGDDISLEAIPNEGYSFVSWIEDGIEVSTDSIFTFTASKSRVLIATFNINNYLITTSSFPIIGGVTSGGGSFDAGELVQLSATPVDGYEFSSWTENDSIVSSDSLYAFIADGNHNLIANFSIYQYQVSSSAIPNEGGLTAGDSIYSHGSLVTLFSHTTFGWKFDYWSEGSNVLSVDTIYSFVLFSDRQINAHFSKRIYEIDALIEADGAGTVSGTGFYSHDSMVTLIATPSQAWNFEHWVEDEKIISSDSILTFGALEDRTIIAKFSMKIYEITTQVYPESGGISIGDSNYVHGDSVVIKALPDYLAGWDFVKWTEDGNDVSTDSILIFVADDNRSLIANFQLRNYNLDLQAIPDEGGDVIGKGNYTHGDSVTIEASPKAGWLFANWTESGINISNETKITFEIKNHRNIIANFAHELYMVVSTPEPAEAGFISGSGSFYYGQNAILIPNAHEGWEFVNWTQDNNVISSDSLLNITVTSNMDIKANYKLKNYTISCSANPPDAGITAGCGLYHYNQEMVLEATPNNGWEFENWTENGEIVSTSSDYPFTVEYDRNLVANFKLITGLEMNSSDLIPEDYSLSNAYPNPFNPSTKLNFGIPESSTVKIILININGQIVRTILNDAILPAGNYKTTLQADDLASGIYLYVFLAQSGISDANFKKIEKLVLLK